MTMASPLPPASVGDTAARARRYTPRPGTGGLFLVAVVIAWVESAHPPGLKGDTAIRAATAGSVRCVFLISFGLACFWALERLLRRWGNYDALVRSLGRPKLLASVSWLATGIAVGAGSLIAWDHVLPAVDKMWSHGPPGTYNELPPLHAATVAMVMLGRVVLVPISEEMLFRGCLQSWLRRRLPAGVAIAGATLAFTFAHGIGHGAYNSVQLLGVGLSGLLYAVLYELSGALAPSILAHAAWNGSIEWANASARPVALPVAVLLLAAVALTLVDHLRTGPRLPVSH